jgi:alkylated DNA nucleotide flippase Atl1
VSVHDVPSETFEATERGIVLHGTTVVPWHRVIRYERELTLTLGDPDLPTNAEIRAWLDDGTGSGEHLTVRADRFEPGPWTADFVIEGTMNVETSTLHLTKIHVPWTRVLEYERLFAPATMPARPD